MMPKDNIYLRLEATEYKDTKEFAEELSRKLK